MDVLLQQVINGLVLGSMYALVALGYTMVYGIINLVGALRKCMDTGRVPSFFTKARTSLKAL